MRIRQEMDIVLERISKDISDKKTMRRRRWHNEQRETRKWKKWKKKKEKKIKDESSTHECQENEKCRSEQENWPWKRVSEFRARVWICFLFMKCENIDDMHDDLTNEICNNRIKQLEISLNRHLRGEHIKIKSSSPARHWIQQKKFEALTISKQTKEKSQLKSNRSSKQSSKCETKKKGYRPKKQSRAKWLR